MIKQITILFSLFIISFSGVYASESQSKTDFSYLQGEFNSLSDSRKFIILTHILNSEDEIFYPNKGVDHLTILQYFLTALNENYNYISFQHHFLSLGQLNKKEIEAKMFISSANMNLIKEFSHTSIEKLFLFYNVIANHELKTPYTKEAKKYFAEVFANNENLQQMRIQGQFKVPTTTNSLEKLISIFEEKSSKLGRNETFPEKLNIELRFQASDAYAKINIAKTMLLMREYYIKYNMLPDVSANWGVVLRLDSNNKSFARMQETFRQEYLTSPHTFLSSPGIKTKIEFLFSSDRYVNELESLLNKYLWIPTSGESKILLGGNMIAGKYLKMLEEYSNLEEVAKVARLLSTRIILTEEKMQLKLIDLIIRRREQNAFLEGIARSLDRDFLTPKALSYLKEIAHDSTYPTYILEDIKVILSAPTCAKIKNFFN
jgi:hypothetical protein